MILSTILSALCLPLYHITTVLAAPQPPTIEILHQFPTGTRAEHLCVLHNGSLLITILTSSTIPDAQFLNSMTTAPSSRCLLLIADSTPGLI
jgi:hypothetical protein